MDISEEVTATLRAQEHGHPPCVLAAGFCKECSAQSRSIGYEEERAPTLRAGAIPTAVYENHSQDTRYTGPLDTAPTVSSTYGTGGNNQPFVVQADTPKTLKIRSGCEGGGKGALIQEDVSATLSCNNDQSRTVCSATPSTLLLISRPSPPGSPPSPSVTIATTTSATGGPVPSPS